MHSDAAQDTPPASVAAPVPMIPPLVFDINPALPAADQALMRSMLESSTSTFAPSVKATPKPSPDVVHSIHLSDPSPIKQQAYRQSPAKQDSVRANTRALLADDTIEVSFSAWSSPVVLVPKHDGTYRMCIDYRKVNARTVKDAYPIPRIDDCLSMCREANFLTLIDIKDAYHHVPMDEASKSITAFVTPDGLFQFKRMPFGLCNAPATFQRYVDRCLRGLIGVTCAAFFDDCLVYTTGSIALHAQHVKAVLDRLGPAGLEVNSKKCKFGYEEMLFVGHIVRHGTVVPDPSKIRAVTEYPRPSDISMLRSFLGLINYYHKFIWGFALLALPLYNLQRKGVVWEWTAACEAAFIKLKAALVDVKCLYAPNCRLPYILETDASLTGIAAVLTQTITLPDGTKEDHPVAFISRQLNIHEKNYTVSEIECLCVVWAVGQFEHHLIDAPFTIVTDHAALVWLPTKKFENTRIMRWAMKLAEFKYTVVHRPGTQHVNADALSRAPVPDSAPPADSQDDPMRSIGDSEPRHVRRIFTAGESPPVAPLYVRSELAALPGCPFPIHAEACSFNRQVVQRVVTREHASSLSRQAEGRPTARDTPAERRSVPPERPSARPARAPRAAVPGAAAAVAASAAASPSSAAPRPPSPHQHGGLPLSGDVTLLDASAITKLVDAQYADLALAPLIDHLASGSIPAHYEEGDRARFLRRVRNYTLQEQAEGRPALFYYPAAPLRGLSALVPFLPRLVVPRAYVTPLIQLFHDTAFGGHFGIKRTLRKIAVNYHWSSLAVDVTSHVNACPACQAEKTQRRQRAIPAGLIEQPKYPFDLISIDFIGPLTRSEDFSYVLMIIDHFSHFAVAVPTKNCTAETVVTVLLDEVFYRYGTPTRLLSDRGSAFHSKLCREINAQLRVKQLFTSAYHPQANGMVERLNSTVKDILYALQTTYGRQWVQILQAAMFAYNSSTSEVTGHSPFYLLYGRSPNSPGDALAHAANVMLDADSPAIPEEAFTRLTRENHALAHDFVSSLLDRKKLANDRARLASARVPVYSPGEQVYLRTPESDATTGGNRMHTTPFTGPWTVVKRLSEVSYVLRDDRSPSRHARNQTTAHVSRMKPFRALTINAVSREATPRLAPFIPPLSTIAIRIPSAARHRSALGSVSAEGDVRFHIPVVPGDDDMEGVLDELIYPSPRTSLFTRALSIAFYQAVALRRLGGRALLQVSSATPQPPAAHAMLRTADRSSAALASPNILLTARAAAEGLRLAALTSSSADSMSDAVSPGQSIPSVPLRRRNQQRAGRARHLLSEDAAVRLPLHDVAARYSLPRRS